MDTLEGEPQKEVEQEQPTHKGVLIYEDDLAEGQLLAVHSIKGTNDAAPIMGQAFKVVAVCLPYLVCSLCRGNEPLTVDVRYLNLMKVSEQFAAAQGNLPTRKGPQA